MGQVKLPNNLSLDELLDILKNSENKEQPVIISEDKNDILLFITTLKISKGKEQISKKLIYNLYKQWSKDPVTQNIFSNKIQLYVDYNDRYYFINENDFKLTESIKKLLIPKPDVRKNKHKHNHINNFFNKFNIKKANNNKLWIPRYTFYYLYDSWCFSNNKKNQLGYVNFCKMIDLYLGPIKRLGKNGIRSYGIKKEAIVFNSEFIAKSKEWSDNHYGKKTKKQTRANKISST